MTTMELTPRQVAVKVSPEGDGLITSGAHYYPRGVGGGRGRGGGRLAMAEAGKAHAAVPA